MPSSSSWRSDRARGGSDGRRPGAAGLLLAGLIGAAGLGGAACATPAGSQVQTDLDAIQQQLWKIQKENAALMEKIAAQPPPAAEGGPPVAAELRVRVEALERDLKAMRVRAEESELRLGAVVQDLRATRTAIEAIMRAPAAPLPDEAAPPSPGSAPAPPPSLPPPSAAEALEDLYHQAYIDYTKGNYALALQGLEDFQRRHPGSDLADDAQYLIGEIHFGQGRHAEAIAALDRMIQTYPRGDKASSAYLKKGLALLEMNRTADAVIQLQHVINTYPRSEDARQARERLRALGLSER